MYTCETCSKEFGSKQKLAGHSSSHRLAFDEIQDVRARKRRLISERGHVCEVCHLSTWIDKEIPLEIDHIDGNPGNDLKLNLRLLCANCHAQTSSYRGRNRGKNKGTKRQEIRSQYPNYRNIAIEKFKSELS